MTDGSAWEWYPLYYATWQIMVRNGYVTFFDD